MRIVVQNHYLHRKATFDALAHAGVIASDNQIKLPPLGDSLERVKGGAVEVSVWAL